MSTLQWVGVGLGAWCAAAVVAAPAVGRVLRGFAVLADPGELHDRAAR